MRSFSERMQARNLRQEKVRAEAILSRIETFHHAFLRRELPKLAPLVEKVAKVHIGQHPELADLSECFDSLRNRLEQSVHHEKTSLFPILRQLTSSSAGWESDCDRLRRATQVFLLKQEKIEFGTNALCRFSSDFTIPDDACRSYQLMLEGLKGLHSHLDKELKFEAVTLLPLLAAAVTPEFVKTRG